MGFSFQTQNATNMQSQPRSMQSQGGTCRRAQRARTEHATRAHIAHAHAHAQHQHGQEDNDDIDPQDLAKPDIQILSNENHLECTLRIVNCSCTPGCLSYTIQLDFCCSRLTIASCPNMPATSSAPLPPGPSSGSALHSQAHNKRNRRGFKVIHRANLLHKQIKPR